MAIFVQAGASGFMTKPMERPARWPALMDRATAAEYLGCSVTTFDAARDCLPSPFPHSLDSRPRWKRADIDRWLEGWNDAGVDPFLAALDDGKDHVARRPSRHG